MPSRSSFANLTQHSSITAQRFTLPNGLTIIIEEDHNAPVVSVQAWCATGSIDEGKWLGAGLSHILEHMLFKGTAKRPPGVIAKEVQEQGGYMNAYTSFDRTVYWVNAPAAGASAIVDILADAVMNAALPVDEYIKEQEVIRREYAMGDDHPDTVLQKLLFKTAYHVSPFAQPVIGYLDIYNQLTREDVLEYYQKRYVPNNICFVIVGDIDAAAIYQQLHDFFAKYPRKALEPVLIKKEPRQLGMNVARDTFPTELSRLNMAWKGPGITDPNTPAVEVLATILGSGTSSILNQEVREKKQLAYQIGAGFYGLSGDEGLIYVGAFADPSKRDALEAEVLTQVEAILEKGVSEKELEKAKNSILADHFSGLATVNGRASDYGSSWLETGNPHFGKEYLTAIERVTRDDIRHVASTYLVREGLTIVSLDPVLNPQGPKTTLSDPKITQREVQKCVLPNGLRLLICEDHRLPLISMMAMFRGGLLEENSSNNGVTDLLASTITKGTKKRTAENIAQTIEQVGASIGAAAGSNSISVSIDHVMTPHCSLGLDLLAEVLTEATFPKEEVEHEKSSQLAAIKAEEDQMLTVAQKLLKKKLFGTHPYSMPLLGTAETVPLLTSEMLQEFREKLIVGKNGVVAIFGDVKTAEVVAMATKLFKKMPAGELHFQSTPEPAALTTAITATATEQKQQAVVVKGFLTVPATSPDRPALELLDSACSDLGSRFFDRIREKQALAYYVGASTSMGLAAGSFVFYMGTDPEKLGHACSEFNDEISKVTHHGLSHEELSKAKKKVLGEEAIAMQSNAGFAVRCLSEELMGLGFDHYLHRTEEINGVTLDHLNNAIKKYFSVPGSVEVTVAPVPLPSSGS
ncbi:MAG: M16 family metallopeptidase [Chthoniobacterales bacterium]